MRRAAETVQLSAHAELRANPEYELLPVECLSPETRRRLGLTDGDEEIYGVLRPRRSAHLPTVAVAPETALVVLTLQRPGPVPAYLLARHGRDTHAMVAELVLDRILEVEVDGRFVSGPEAQAQLFGGARPLGDDPNARLSVAALRHAQALGSNDPLTLAGRLYCYNREPLSPRWKRRLPTPAAVVDFLGLLPGQPTGRILARHWEPVDTAPATDGWYVWQTRHADDLGEDRQWRHKLYLSPRLDALPDLLPAFVESMTELRVSSFKIGKGLAGVLRPDKVVAYFASHEELAEASRRLSLPPVDEECVQGVPFTAAVQGDGLVSRGLDPPRATATEGSEEPSSWRMWVALRLATALVAARQAPSDGLQPWQFALERLRAEGVDPTTWIPSRDLWSSP